MVKEINWEKSAICLSYGKQQFSCVNLDGFLDAKDFQLNEIREGDFIPASELDTEQKYNEVVEVLGLFGFNDDSSTRYYGLTHGPFDIVTVSNSGVINSNFKSVRKLTYSQIIAIGKLKRMMLEREMSNGGYVNEITDNTAEFDAIVSSKSVGISKPKMGVDVVMTNKTAAIKVLEALGMDASFVQSVSINGKEVFNIENADDITTVTVSKYVKKT